MAQQLVHITRNCGLFKVLKPGNAEMVDKGWLRKKIKLLDASSPPGSMLKTRCVVTPQMPPR